MKFWRGLKESRENTMSLTLSGLWLGLCFRSLSSVLFLIIKYRITVSRSLEYCILSLLTLLLFVQQYPYDIPTEAFPFEIFKQAFVAVQSCVVHLQVKLFLYLRVFYLPEL